MIKDKLQTKKVSTEVKIIVLRRNQVVEETILLDEIKRNQTKEQKVEKELEKDNRQAQKDNGIIYMKGRIYVPNSWKI